MDTSKPNAPASESSMNAQELNVVLQEWNTLKELDFALEQSAQSLFNYYLTLVAAFISGAVFVNQYIPSLVGTNSPNFVVIVLLLLSLIGVMYSVSLAHRYADISRYTQALDAIRRNLLSSLQISLPPLYDQFLNDRPIYQPAAGLSKFRSLGTFHTFVTFISSLLLAVGLFLAFLINPPAPGLRLDLLIPVPAFLVLFGLQGYYAHTNKQKHDRILNLRINTRDKSVQSGAIR